MNERVYEEGVIRDIYDRKGYRDFTARESDSSRVGKLDSIF